MIDALKTSTQGLLQAERRATDAAQRILESTSEVLSFDPENDIPPPGPNAIEVPQQDQQNTVTGQSSGSLVNPEGGFGNLIQDIADLKQSEVAFKANAKAFERISETLDESLGSLVDSEG